MSHTPGPWEIIEVERFGKIHVYGPSNKPIVADVNTYKHDGEANARLIATAPELLECLQSCLAYVKRYYKTLPDDGQEQDFLMVAVIYPAEEAIAKAKGE